MRERDPADLHAPVLIQETVHHLALQPGHVVVDATTGLGGHSQAILPRIRPSGRLIAIDCDAEALALAATRLQDFSPDIEYVHDNFQHLPAILQRLGLGQVDAVVADLGISSLQVDRTERGFSFQREGPLDMRMDARSEQTAAELVHALSLDELTELFLTAGEGRWARRIAQRLVAARRRQRLQTTAELATLVREVVRGRGAIHPATRVFLALRMAVNDELANLHALLDALPTVLRPGGRAAIIAFHSLEDRLVKQAFRRGASEGLYHLVTKKVVRPTAQEVRQNPRARSARLRIVERLP